MNYYILQNEETKGPYTLGQLRAMWNSGAITSETLHCQEGDSEWLQLSAIISQLEPPPAPPQIPAAPAPVYYQPIVQQEKKGIGFFGGCMIIIGVIVLLLLIMCAVPVGFIAIPNFVEARAASQRSACIANLKQIDEAKAKWAMENKKSRADTPTTADLYGPTKYIRDEPSCPASGTYSINAVGLKPTCTISGHTL